MPDLAVLIDNMYVPLTQCEWVFRDPCGCPFGVMSAATAGGIIAADEDAAWREFYDNGRERNADRKRGVTAELITLTRYRAEVEEQMRAGSTHVCGRAVA